MMGELLETLGALADLPGVALLIVFVALPLIGRAALWWNRHQEVK